VGAGKSLPPMDMTRFALTPPPTERANDLGAWRTATANARAQLEHQSVRLTNLELLFKFGANASKAQLNHINASAAQSERQVRFSPCMCHVCATRFRQQRCSVSPSSPPSLPHTHTGSHLHRAASSPTAGETGANNAPSGLRTVVASPRLTCSTAR
jgi:hypothetical protein